MWNHLTARTRGGLAPFSDNNVALWAWKNLRRAFPDALAAVLMPTHLHLIAEGAPEKLRRRLANFLGRLSAVHGLGEGAWEPTPQPKPLPDRFHVRRDVRYVALNPCRDGLYKDPLEWRWSTHRDVVGARIDPWVSLRKIAAALGKQPGGFPRAHHEYVSADPSVAVEGTSFPIPAPRREFFEVGLPQVDRAVHAACPGAGPLIFRRLFVRLAVHQGWRQSVILARYLGITPSAVRRIKARAVADDIGPAVLCLGDPRLTAGIE